MRIGAAALAFATGGCNHLALFEDKPQTTAHAPVTQPRKPIARHGQDKQPDKQQIAGLHSGEAGEDAAPVSTATNGGPKRASQLRAQALEQMNRGSIDEAVANLKQAAMLDPSNTLIRRDLDRAMRIQSTVQRAPS
jgi:Flp pilus assembly protein TadD